MYLKYVLHVGRYKNWLQPHNFEWRTRLVVKMKLYLTPPLYGLQVVDQKHYSQGDFLMTILLFLMFKSETLM